MEELWKDRFHESYRDYDTINSNPDPLGPSPNYLLDHFKMNMSMDMEK